MIRSIIDARCPRCRDGKLYPAPQYSSRFFETNAHCPCCGQPFILEPGFFLGSAYFSYFIYAVVLSMIALAWYYFGENISTLAIIGVLLLVVLALLPMVLRVSKSLWIHIFIRYEGPCSKIPRKS